MIPRRLAAALRTVALAAGSLTAAAGCGGGRWITTHRFETPPPPARRTAPVAANVAAAGAKSDDAVTPAGFAPQEFGAGEEGGGLDDLREGGRFDGPNEGSGLTPFDPSAAPSAGPLETGIGDPPSAGPLDAGAGALGQERGDLGASPGEVGGGLGADRPPAARGGGVDLDLERRTPLLPGRADPGDGGGDGDPPDLARPGAGDDPAANAGGPVLTPEDVTASVLAAYPLIAEAAAGRPLGDGLVIEASGAFDTKLKAAQELAPLGFYENYRHSVGVEQPLLGGADLFAGYRIGRGEFEPWYQERQTNDGGEFKAGFTVPLLQDRRIDARRAALQLAALERAAADPAVAAVQLDAVRDGAAAYWEWVAAGRLLAVADRLLTLSLDRTEGLEAQVKAGEAAAITLSDNERLIAARRSKRIGAERKFRQAAAKLSLYLRDAAGAPLVPADELLPAAFPPAGGAAPSAEALIDEALARRPELVSLNLAREQAAVSLAEARNDLLPELDAGLVVSQDVGGLSSSKGDKQPFELDTALVFSVPLQRRKACGKVRQLEAKLAQLTAKRRFAADKATVEVRLAVAALEAAREQIEQAETSVELAERLRDAEVRAFELGESDLLRLNLRESAAASAAEDLIAARFAERLARADLAAATAATVPESSAPPIPAPMPLPLPEPIPAPMPPPADPAD